MMDDSFDISFNNRTYRFRFNSSDYFDRDHLRCRVRSFIMGALREANINQAHLEDRYLAVRETLYELGERHPESISLIVELEHKLKTLGEKWYEE